MKFSASGTLNMILISLLALMLAGFQTSIWDQIFNFFPAPYVWIPCLVYVCLFRTQTEAIFMVYVLSVVLAAFTILPVGLLILINLGVASMIVSVKRRVYFTGVNYFMLMSGAAAAVFTLLHFILSYLLEDRSIIRMQLFFWVLRSLLTALISGPVLPFLRWIDRLTAKEIPAESGQVFE